MEKLIGNDVIVLFIMCVAILGTSAGFQYFIILINLQIINVKKICTLLYNIQGIMRHRHFHFIIFYFM